VVACELHEVLALTHISFRGQVHQDAADKASNQHLHGTCRRNSFGLEESNAQHANQNYLDHENENCRLKCSLPVVGDQSHCDCRLPVQCFEAHGVSIAANFEVLKVIVDEFALIDNFVPVGLLGNSQFAVLEVIFVNKAIGVWVDL
jgi:hypothetical protein